MKSVWGKIVFCNKQSKEKHDKHVNCLSQLKWLNTCNAVLCSEVSIILTWPVTLKTGHSTFLFY